MVESKRLKVLAKDIPYVVARSDVEQHRRDNRCVALISGGGLYLYSFLNDIYFLFISW